MVATGLNGIGSMGEQGGIWSGDWGSMLAGDLLDGLTEKLDIDVQGV